MLIHTLRCLARDGFNAARFELRVAKKWVAAQLWEHVRIYSGEFRALDFATQGAVQRR